MFHGFPSYSKYTVSVVDPQTAASASVSITSSSTGQLLVIPVTLIHVTDPSTTMQGQPAISEWNRVDDMVDVITL